MPEGLLGQIKRLAVGEPIPSHLAHHERLSRVTGLAVLSSDPLSSVAYATEEIVRVLILVNVSALTLASPIAAIIASIPIITIRLLAIVVMIATVAALWNLMLWLPWQIDCLIATAASFAFAYRFERGESQ